MHEAQRLGVKVTLCPYINDADVKYGKLDQDVCIKNIKTPVDSENAYCGQESDKKQIHAAICNSENGFKGINASVKRIRIEYLMNYPVNKIKGIDAFDDYTESEQKIN